MTLGDIFSTYSADLFREVLPKPIVKNNVDFVK
jgi:hypothetical protein